MDGVDNSDYMIIIMICINMPAIYAATEMLNSAVCGFCPIGIRGVFAG